MSGQQLNPRQMASGSIVLPLPECYRLSSASSLPGPRMELRRKPEIHVTLLGSRLLRRLARRTSAEHLLALARDQAWVPARTGDGALMRDESRPSPQESLVEWIDLEGWEAFRASVAELMQEALPDTRPHITQYATNARGIGLPDMRSIARMKVAELRLPGIAPRAPCTPSAEVAARFKEGCTLLREDVAVRIGEQSQPVDRWLHCHRATRALVFSAADPFDSKTDPSANAVRWALLRAEVEARGWRHVWVGGKEDDDESLSSAICFLDLADTAADALLRDYEQLAAVVIEKGREARLHVNPTANDSH